MLKQAACRRMSNLSSVVLCHCMSSCRVTAYQLAFALFVCQENRRHRRLMKKAQRLDAQDLIEIAGMKKVERDALVSALSRASGLVNGVGATVDIGMALASSSSSSSSGASSSSGLAASGSGDHAGERLGPTSVRNPLDEVTEDEPPHEEHVEGTQPTEMET